MHKLLATNAFFKNLQQLGTGFLHLLYPEICMHCGSEELTATKVLCEACEKNLPYCSFLDRKSTRLNSSH